MTTRILSIIVLASLVAAVITSGCAKQDDVILIGECTPQKGQTADMGRATHEGIMLAIDEINERGGLLNQRVELRHEDDRGDSSEARTAFEKLINREHVVAIIGEIASKNTMFAAPVAQSNKVPMITPAATNPEVTEAGDYVFRVCFTDDFQGAVCATFARNHLKAERAAVLRDIKNDYSKGLADAFRATFEKKGGKVVVDTNYNEGDSNFKSQLTTIKSKDPDVVFIPGYYKDVSLIAVQARQLGIRVPLIGGDGWNSPSLVPGAGRALEGCFFSNHFTARDKQPAVERFIKSFNEKYGKQPNSFAALGYDAAWILAEAIKKAGSTEGDAIRRALSQTKDYPGVTGRITIDSKRNASKPAVIVKIKGDEFVPVTSFSPNDIK